MCRAVGVSAVGVGGVDAGLEGKPRARVRRAVCVCKGRVRKGRVCTKVACAKAACAEAACAKVARVCNGCARVQRLRVKRSRVKGLPPARSRTNTRTRAQTHVLAHKHTHHAVTHDRPFLAHGLHSARDLHSDNWVEGTQARARSLPLDNPL